MHFITKLWNRISFQTIYLFKTSISLDMTSMFCSQTYLKQNDHLIFQLTHPLCLVKYKYLVFSKNDKRLQVNCLYLLSKRIWYPIVWPILSLLSAATLSATAIAANRLGWVQNIRQGIPFLKQSSKRNWGIWNKF